MKIAFHFDEKELGGGSRAIVSVLSALRAYCKSAHTKIFCGSLLFMQSATRFSSDQNATIGKVDPAMYTQLIAEWSSPQSQRYFGLFSHAKHVATEKNVYAVCLESVDTETASRIDRLLKKDFTQVYLGALEVDGSIASHLGAYQLMAIGRVFGTIARVFWDGISEDSQMQFQIDWFRNAGFTDVSFESLEGRFSIFDSDHGASQDYRNSQTRTLLRDLFDSVLDHVTVRLADGAPEIPEKLWAMLSQFREIKVNEQASMVALSCRRIFECVADSLFPPTDEKKDGRDLGTNKFKNRLLRYLQDNRVSQTEQALVVATMQAAAAELDNLYEYTNKGVHSAFEQMQARRCILRTLLLLDDLIAVRKNPLETRV